MKESGNNTASRHGWLQRWSPRVCLFACLSGLAAFLLLVSGFFCESTGLAQSAPAAPHAAAPASGGAPQSRPVPGPMPEARSGVQPNAGPGVAPPRAGQQHLPEWWSTHRNLTPSQQVDALRREPGFHNLPQDQQQRLINRLQSLDEKTPQQRQRMLQRNEAFERLTPERRQEVRGAAQALRQMSPDREQVVRRAFQQLRHMPPEQREQLLHSKIYGGQFSPQERTVLGNLLAIEPYEASRTIPQPYFGRP